MDAYSSCISEDDEGRALKGLLDAFGSAFSLEEIAHAYCKGGNNVDIAAEILFGLQEGNSSDVSHLQDTAAHASKGEYSGSRSQELPRENNYEMVTHPRKNSKGTKPRKVSYSIGTVSSVLGKGYARPASSSQDVCKLTKPLKVEIKEPLVNDLWEDGVVSNFAPRNEPMNNKDVEEFLFLILGDGYQLGMDVIQQVLSQCGYDAKKSMDRLMDLSRATLGKREISLGDSTRKVISTLDNRELACSSKESHSSQDRLQIMDFGQSGGAMGRNGTESPSIDKEKHDLSREVLEALFSVREKSEETPRKNRPVRAVKKKAIGQVVTAPFTDVAEEPLATIIEPQESQDDAKDAEEDKYEVLRRVAKQNWNVKRIYYEAALDAFLKGNRAQANYFLEEGKNYDKKAREADEESSGVILEVRKNGVKEFVTLDVHNYPTKDAIQLLKIPLKSLSGIASFQFLKVIVEADAEDITKGTRKRLVLKLLEKESIKWMEEEGNPGTILIRMDEINPRNLSFA